MAKGPDISQLVTELKAHGAKDEHVRRVLRAWMHWGDWEPKSGSRYPKSLVAFLPEFQERLSRLARVLTVPSRQTEAMKLIVSLEDGECVESVLLPRQGLCVSTQVGCAVGCQFCQTGKGGLLRQLSSAEILVQLEKARAIRAEIKKIVFMGMGEPSHNLRAVLEAVDFLGTVMNLAHKDIVLSTVGDIRLFDALSSHKVKPALALSLHTTDNGLRRELVPNGAALSVEELLERTLSYSEAVKYPAQIEWTLIAGVNDKPEQVRRLAELLRGRYAMVNFIAVNPVEGTNFVRPEQSHIEDLITILRRAGIVATLRMSAAQDVEGGCGQLRARVIRQGLV